MPHHLSWSFYVAFFLSQKSTLFCGACFVDATGGELSPTILLPVPVLDTLVKGSKNCSAFSDKATWLQLDALFLVDQTKYF